jgi:hypothetical protein
MERVRLAPPATRSSVLSRRIGRLTDAGFGRALAERLARGERYDLHALLELADRGCRPGLAARILAPLEDEGGRC